MNEEQELNEELKEIAKNFPKQTDSIFYLKDDTSNIYSLGQTLKDKSK